MTQIELDGLTIEIIRKPIKNMHLRIYPPDGRIRVSAPLGMSMRNIQTQLSMKREWIHTQHTRLKEVPISLIPSMQTGENHFFLGQIYSLYVVETGESSQVILRENSLFLHTKHTSTPSEKLALLNAWYLLQMASLLPDLINKWEAIIGVKVKEWKIRAMKTRWGSCNIRTHRICLNLTLIKKPLSCLESVLVHEMIHLLEPSHNSRFYELMDTFMPKWRTYQTDLKILH